MCLKEWNEFEWAYNNKLHLQPWIKVATMNKL